MLKTSSKFNFGVGTSVHLGPGLRGRDSAGIRPRARLARPRPPEAESTAAASARGAGTVLRLPRKLEAAGWPTGPGPGAGRAGAGLRDFEAAPGPVLNTVRFPCFTEVKPVLNY